jgi:hypothetical protein
MLATPEDNMAGTMSCASLTDVIKVATEQWSAQNGAFIVKKVFLENVDFSVVTP